MTAPQYPMFTLPIPPDEPLHWGGPAVEVPPPLQVPPVIQSQTATPAGGECDFTCTTDVPCDSVLDSSGTPPPPYVTTGTPMDSGNGTVTQHVHMIGFTPGATYHYRFLATGSNPPNELETIGADQTFVAA